ncbi:hypothetical protein Tco_0926780 [Tanacetum coccineum]|uniref:Uncharacterized protein n=1 Tax=Tanacetum coccineum TaxID=301880 RepID=A0ABQ5DDQ0_9ASTR
MVFNSPCLTDKKELIHHEVEMVINSPWIMPLLGTKGLASPEQTATANMCRIFKYSSQDSSRLDVAAKFIFQSSRYVVPASKVIIIVSPGRLSLVPTDKVLSPGRVK